jgi:SagB-type dehydrogenase family enzyme
MGESTEVIKNYHQRTKHYPHRYARSAGYLDWESEPNPFRRYEGAPLVRLPLLKKDSDGIFQGMFDRKGIEPRPFTIENIACFLELSLGLSAWKSYGENSWALRMNPSSGNLHPVEGSLVLPPLRKTDIPGGVYHYSPFFHGIELRAAFDEGFWSRLRQDFPAGFFAGLSSIHWRESWKYGERAFRYSHLDTGHAVAAMSFSASLLGWKVTYLNELSDHEVETILGFVRIRWRQFEREEPGPLFFVHEATEHGVPRGLTADVVRSFESLSFSGEPHLLSSRHQDWGVIDEASEATVKPATQEETYSHGNHPSAVKNAPQVAAASVIRKRRSALAFDARTALERERFFDILDRTIPRDGCSPFDTDLSNPSINLLIFAHSITGLDPGLYFLIREKKAVEEIQRKLRPGFLWDKAPEALPLYSLEQGDFRSKAQAASCDQGIASDGAFAVAMIAEFRHAIAQGSYRYRQLHWEAGMIGQVLYLSSEAHGMRGTGMGCFFDDVVHKLLGLTDDTYQDLYHFGAGKPLEDTRIATLPAYQHLKKK